MSFGEAPDDIRDHRGEAAASVATSRSTLPRAAFHNPGTVAE